MPIFPKKLYASLLNGEYANHTKERILYNTNLNAGENILDIGGFPFSFAEAMSAKGHNITVQTLPLEGLASGLYNVEGNDSIKICLSEIEDLKNYLEPESFDTITCFEVIEHFDTYPDALFLAFRTLGKENSNLLLSTPNVASLWNILKLIFNRNIFNSYSNLKYTRHYHEYTTQQLKCLVEWEGFKDCKIEVLNPYLSNTFFKFVDKLIGRYSAVIYIEARRSGKTPHSSKCTAVFKEHQYE